MEELITFLLYAGFFYFMMRFTCGAHMIHGTHQHKSEKSIDPVCGMEVAQEEGFSKMYHGKEYRFCSRNCLIKFDDTPDVYLNSDGDTP
jgi:YHS domain-containing protein